MQKLGLLQLYNITSVLICVQTLTNASSLIYILAQVGYVKIDFQGMTVHANPE
jgi:hypothetical protein